MSGVDLNINKMCMTTMTNVAQYLTILKMHLPELYENIYLKINFHVEMLPYS